MSDPLDDELKDIFQMLYAMAIIVAGLTISGVLDVVAATESVLFAPLIVANRAFETIFSTISAFTQYLPIALSVVFLFITLSATADKASQLPNPYETSAFGERKRVVESETTVDECINCELQDVEGVKREARREQVVAGRVVRVLDRTTTNECQACRDADTVDYALRAERDDPATPNADDQDDVDDEIDAEDLTRIKFVGDSVAANLRDAGFETVDDVRDADPAELVEIAGIGDQRVDDIQIGANPVALELGFSVARRLADAGFETVDDIRQADVDDLTDARRVGEVTAEQVLDVDDEIDTEAEPDQDDDQVDAVRLECPGCGAFIESTRPFEASDCPSCGEFTLRFDDEQEHEPVVDVADE